MHLFRLLSIALALAITLPAATIISVSDSDPDAPGSFAIASNRTLAVSWTTPIEAFTNVTIQAAVGFQSSAGGNAFISAFVTRVLGPAATVADELAATGTIATPIVTPNTAAPLFQLFTGLTLAPNTTYFLSLFYVSGGTATWDGENPYTTSSDVGATLNSTFFLASSSIDGTYGPASPYSLQTFGPGFFSVTGDAVGGDVPEPPTIALVGLGLAGAGLLRRRRA